MLTEEGDAEVLSTVVPKVEAEILRCYASLGKLLESSSPEVKLHALAQRAVSAKLEIQRARDKQRELIETGANLLQECVENCQSIQERRSEEENAKDPAFILLTRVKVLRLRRLCIQQSLRRDLYSPPALTALTQIRSELESRIEATRDRIAVQRDKLDRFTHNPRLRQCCEEFQSVQLQIRQKRRDIEKLGG